MEKIVKETNITEGFALRQTIVGLLAYACDIATIGSNVEEVKSISQKLIKTAGKNGLVIIEEKTECMVLNRKEVNF